MEYKITLKKEGRGEALRSLLNQFTDVKLSGTIQGIKDITNGPDSAEAVIDFNVDELVKLAVGDGFKTRALDIFEFASVDIESLTKKKTQATPALQTKKTSKPKAKKSKAKKR